MSDRIDIIAENNRDALRRLTRIVTRSQGFSLSIALCNYRVLQERVLQDLRSQLAENDLPENAVAIIELKPDAKTLLAPIQVLMGKVQQLPPEQKPKVLMVLGLDAVTEIEVVLKSANRVREEFANCLEFPMVLWLNDRTQDILTREASDLANWTTAGAIEFQLEMIELKALVQGSLKAIFNRYLQPQRLGLWNASLQQMELMTAIAELKSQKIAIDQELKVGLDFAFGCMAMTEGEIEKAQDLFQKSLAFWRQSGAQPEQAVCLLQLGMCDQNKAFRDRYHKQPFYESAQTYLAESIAILRNLQLWELVALYINFLTAIMEESQAFEGLESLANEALGLHQTYPNQLREAHDRGILASVKLWQKDYNAAKELAESALALHHEGETLKLSNLIPSQRYAYGKIELWLARALEGLGDRQGAIKRLEVVKASWNHQYDAQIYVAVLEELRSLYTSAGLYLEAFATKQHQRAVEQQYGLRAFIGAGILNPKRETNNSDIYTAISIHSDEIAQEIEASGRMPDVEKLVDRIGQARFPLTIVHGDSGAGKSSILSGGVIPALRLRQSFDGRKVLVLTVKTYKDWSAEIQQQLQDYFGDRRPLLDPIHHFKRNIEENYLTVIIFDQFEDFFFKKEDFRDRLPFYKFLKACLHTDFVRVVLSLRDDYLHYLLECDRAVDLEKVENDILGKQVRYYLGDFTRVQARQVIEALTRRSQLRLEPELIDRLVTDLSGEQLRILPIELQVVGAQLESENPPISTLQQYLALTNDTHRKPSEVLVERWLENVVRDCGVANKDLAERVLYALTGNEEKRPQKTQAELASELLAEEDLSLVLAVLVGSGLAFRVSSTPDDRFQLIHDYLVSFIRKKYVFGIAEELRMTKEQLRSALAEKEKELQRAEIAEIEALSISCEAYWLAHKELEAMVAGLRAARKILNPDAYYIIPIHLKNKTFGRLWEILYNIREINRIEIYNHRVTTIEFSPNSTMIAYGSYGNNIKVCNLEGKELNTLIGHTSAIVSISFSPNNKTIASCSYDKTIILWDLKDGKLLTINDDKDYFTNVVFSPDGCTIASVITNKIKLWSILGDLLLVILSPMNNFCNIAFSPDGKLIASGVSNNAVKIWNLKGEELITLRGHDRTIYKLAFSPDGKLIASGGGDGKIKLWNLNGDELLSIDANLSGSNLIFSSDGQTIASTSFHSTVNSWDLQGKNILSFRIRNEISTALTVAISHNIRTIASASIGYNNSISLWLLNTRKPVIINTYQESFNSFSFSDDSQKIVSGSRDNSIKIWDLYGKELMNISGHSKPVLGVYFSNNGKKIISFSQDNTIRIWRLDNQQSIVINGSKDVFISMSICNETDSIISGSDEGIITLWDLKGEAIFSINGHSQRITNTTFSHDGNFFASGDSDGIIKLWNSKGINLFTIKAHQNFLFDLAFSPNERKIISSSVDGTIKLWDFEGKELFAIQGHQDIIRTIAFSPDGHIIVSGGDDGKIKLWSLDGKELLCINEYSLIWGVAISPDGKILASISSKNTIKLWNIDPDLAISEACDWLRPYLTNNPNVSESDRQLLEGKK